MKVVVIGQGYVGLPVSMRGVEVGHDVVGLEIDPVRVGRLALGQSFVEDVSSDALDAALASGRYLPTADVAHAASFNVAVITVPTPLREGAPDLSFIESSSSALAPHVSAGSCVILESTTYPGTTEELVVPLLEEGSGLKAGVDFHVGYSPERIDPGNPTFGFKNTPKVISGINAASLEAVRTFYAGMVDRVVEVRGCKEAELTKLLENTFRHVNVALVNELAIYANELGIDVWDAIDAASTKPFGYMRFTPGPGVGGHCLPIDPSYLSWRVKQTLDQQFRFVELANDINHHMPQYVVTRASLLLNERRQSVRGSRILLIGLAYKKNSSDIRESPSVRVAELLLALGGDVAIVEPHLDALPADLGGARLVELDVALSDDVDLAIVLTDHDAVDYGQLTTRGVPVFDTRRRLPGGPNVYPL